MTLCMAAVCYDEDANKSRIAFAWDRRVENAWAGANVAFKFAWVMKDWTALLAGESSKAADFLATCRAALEDDDEPLTRTNIFDKFNDISATHKEKLCRRYVRQQLGIDFERFLTQGEDELPPEVRGRIFHELGQLEYGCELLVFGFTRRVTPTGVLVFEPHIIEIDRYGEVYSHTNFAAIGTGSVIAKSTLYHREQEVSRTIEDTFYNLYEASKLAAWMAPGVGLMREFLVLDPPDEDGGQAKLWGVSNLILARMEGVFQEVGPKPLKELAKFVPGDLEIIVPAPQAEQDATQSPETEEPGQPSDLRT